MAEQYSTGLELVLCACERELMIVLTDDEELVSASVWNIQDRAAELLAPTLRQIFSLAGRSFQELRRLGCFNGPGSFTGIRLVLATAQALRRTTKVQLATLDYLRAVATTLAMGENILYGRRIRVLTHARRGLVHAADYLSLGPVIPGAALGEPRLVSLDAALEEALEAARGEPEPVFLTGSALVRNKDFPDRILEKGEGRLLPRPLSRPSIDALRLLGRHGDYFPKDVEPFYLRPCDAVDNLPEIAGRMGKDADASAEELRRLMTRMVRDETDRLG